MIAVTHSHIDSISFAGGYNPASHLHRLFSLATTAGVGNDRFPPDAEGASEAAEALEGIGSDALAARDTLAVGAGKQPKRPAGRHGLRHQFAGCPGAGL